MNEGGVDQMSIWKKIVGVFDSIFNGRANPDQAVDQIKESEPPEVAALRFELNKKVEQINVHTRQVGVGHREQRRRNAELLELAIAEADEFCKANPATKITNIEDVRSLAYAEKCRTAPLFKTSREDTYFVCLLDTETTGIGDDDEPISVGAMLVEVTQKLGDHVREIDRYVGFREPGVPISQRANQVHGMTEDDLRGKSFDLERLHSIIDSADVIVAHNADFDCRMMSKIIPGITTATWACSMNDLRWLWKEINGGRKGLDSICQTLGINKSDTHDAMGDVEALYQVLQRRTGKTNRSRTYLQPLIKKAFKEDDEIWYS